MFCLPLRLGHGYGALHGLMFSEELAEYRFRIAESEFSIPDVGFALRSLHVFSAKYFRRPELEWRFRRYLL